jgi:hypothetical protein
MTYSIDTRIAWYPRHSFFVEQSLVEQMSRKVQRAPSDVQSGTQNNPKSGPVSSTLGTDLPRRARFASDEARLR